MWTKWRRLVWSSKTSKKFTILFLFLILCVFLWFHDGSRRSFVQKLKNESEQPVTHVVIPHVVGRQDRHLQHHRFENDSKIAVVVMSATRPAAIKNHLSQLLKYRPDPDKFPVFVSQDGDNKDVTNIIKSYVNDSEKIYFIHHKTRNGLGTPIQRTAKSYFFIAQHYKFALDKIFKEYGYNTVIITEDDLDIAEDFFSYFQATKHLLYEDPSIWCVSAWNDNGAAALVDRGKSEKLYRTDFFPGLGWMLTSDIWNELTVQWPEAYWDDWLRRQDIRKNRVCIRPEVSRTAHNNRLAGKGSSNGLYKKFLASIGLPDAPVDFSLVDTERLKKKNYDPFFGSLIVAAKELKINDLIERKTSLNKDISYRVRYMNPREYRMIAKAFGLMNDIRSGMARTAYYGVVPFRVDEAQVYAIHGNLDLSKSFGEFPTWNLYHDDWDKMAKYLDFAEFYCKPGKWTGRCDPQDPGMIAWFKKRNQTKRLQAWGEMIVI